MNAKATRREFLKGTVMIAVGIAAASCAQPTPQIIEKEVPVEKVVKETVVVQKEVSVEKVVTATPVAMKYKEAPMLAGLVQSGQLPPVDERLPENPAVVTPFEEVGEYGGTWHRLATQVSDIQIPFRLMADTLVHWDKDGTGVMANLAESYEVSPDGKVFTFKLRKGTKWSDGEPYTADDIMFRYEDVLLNTELTANFPSNLSPGGEKVKIEKLDDYSVRMTFGTPYPMFILLMATAQPGVEFVDCPKHWLTQFHVKYAKKEELDKRVKDGGVEFWYQLFNNMGGSAWSQALKTYPEVPVIHAWRVTVPAPKQPVVLERNPYYWKVDTAGNQLPYIDRVEHMLVQGADQVNLRAIAGEVDMQLRHITWVNYPLYIENQQKGDYRILQWPQGYVTDACIQPALEHKDPVLKAILGDKRFRYALSLGINREEIIEAVYLGTAEPTQVAPLKSSPYYWEEQAKNLVEYDPDRANGYLDEMGLTQKDAEGFRLRPDGKRLSLIFSYAPTFGQYADIAALLTAQWKKLGIELVPNEVSRQLWEERNGANEVDITVWTSGGEFNPLLFNEYFCGVHAVQVWRNWINTKGAQGIEPPESFKRQRELAAQILVTVDEAERAKMLREILEIHKDEMRIIGICTAAPQAVVVKNSFRNVPESAVSDWNLLTPGNAFPEQFYIKPS